MSRPAWYTIMAEFENPSLLKSSWQIINTLVPYFFLWYVMVRALQTGYSLQWFSGNIGYHHIHHIKPLIPNYRLEECYKAIPDLKEIKLLTIGKSLRSLRLHLWDETPNKLVSFRSLQ